jgi:branched-chain amino acid transport system substrate-binding protein
MDVVTPAGRLGRASFLAGSAAAAGALAIPTFARAAGGTVRIGMLDSYSGVLSDIGGFHKIGATIALDEINRRSKTKFELVYGDDNSKPAVGTTEVRRLVEQEKVDAIVHGVSSAVALAIMPYTLQNGVFTLEIGPQDTAITADKASLTTYRLAPDAGMFTKVLAQRILARGKKWYFVVEDYAFGKDSYARLAALLKRAGGTEVGADILKVGTNDFSSTMTKIRNTDADQVVLCQGGLDVALAAKAFVEFGLSKKMKLAGMTLEDFYYKALPLDALEGGTFAVIWSPNLPEAQRITATLKKKISGPISYRHYMGYLAIMQLADRMHAAGTTKADALVKAFANHSFDAGKADKSTWRGCDHQLIQDTYAGEIVGAKEFAKTGFMFRITGETTAADSSGTCASPDATAAANAFAAQKIGDRPGYEAKTVA